MGNSLSSSTGRPRWSSSSGHIAIAVLVVAVAALVAGSAAAQVSELGDANDFELASELEVREPRGMTTLGPAYVQVAIYNGEAGSRLGLTNFVERTLWVSAVNGSTAVAKVRMQVFDSKAQLLSEQDLSVQPGHSERLLDPITYHRAGHHLIEPFPSRVTLVVGSDHPISVSAHEQDFNYDSALNYSAGAQSQHATESKRNLPFERIQCPEWGREWLCAAPTVETPWDDWATLFDK